MQSASFNDIAACGAPFQQMSAAEYDRHMDVAHVASYSLVAGLAIMAPGADFAILLKHAGRGGRATGLRAAAGVTTGFAVHALVAAIGVGALLVTSATAFTVVKLLGAVYLGYLGVRALWSAAHRGSAELAPKTAGRARSRPYREALLINVLNPKVILTYLALMPQFLPPEASIAATFTLSVATITIAGLWFGVLALVIGSARKVLANQRVRRILDAASGFVLISLGVRLALARR